MFIPRARGTLSSRTPGANGSRPRKSRPDALRRLLAQRNAAAASQPDEKTSQEFVVFYLKNVQATEAARIVRQVFGGKVKPAVEERTNSLIVASDDPLTVNRVRELLQAIELPAAKGLALPQVAQSVDDLRRLYNELEQRTRELADGLRVPQRILPREAIAEELRVLVKHAFEARQKLQRAELAEFAKRLQGIQQSIEMRDRVSQQIIDRRVEELLDPNLKWDSADREGLLNPQSDSSSILSPLKVGQRILLKSQAGNYRITIMNATIVKAMEANAAEIGSTYEPDTVVEIGNDAIVVDKAGLKKVIPVSAIVEIRSMPDEDKKIRRARRSRQKNRRAKTLELVKQRRWTTRSRCLTKSMQTIHSVGFNRNCRLSK